MEFKEYVRKPFVVEAVQITQDNIEELAKYIGTIGYKDDGTAYIQVDRTKIPNIDRVYVGFYMTKIGRNTRCYSYRAFTMQFVENDEVVKTWVDYINKPAEEEQSVKDSTEGANV